MLKALFIVILLIDCGIISRISAAATTAPPAQTPTPAPTSQPTPAANPASAESKVQQQNLKYAEGDTAFLERKNPVRAKEAYHLYEKYYKKNPSDPEAGWRFGMGSYNYGLRYASNDDEKKQVFEAAFKAAEAALKLKPNCVQCHFWSAVNMALYGQTVGIFKTLSLLNPITDHLEAAVKLDPTYAWGGAYRTLGILQQKLPGIFGGSNKRAKIYFEKAINAGPDEPLNYLFLARILVEEFDDVQGGLEVAKRGLAVKFSEDRLEAIDANKELHDFVAKYESKNQTVSTESNKR